MYTRALQCCVLAFVIFNANGNKPKNKNNTSLNKKTDLRFEDGDSPELEEDSGDNGNNIPDIGDDNGYDEGSIQPGDLNYVQYSGDYPGGTEQLPSGRELLDRSKPEPGFDLSQSEIKKFKLWPNAFIPYYIDVHSFSDKVLRDKIRSFLSSVNSLTTLNFVELPSPPYDDSRWVLFINRRSLLGCADHSIKNFTNSGVQHVILGYHCMSTEGELAEAVLAIAGVPAQHTAPDRDYYIQVNNNNIIPEKRYLFDKLADNEWLFHDLEYDFHSAGHFQSYRHSANGRASIEPTEKASDIVLGQAKELSPIDILKIRMLYNYMVNKRLLQAPDCHKLFEPGKKFNDYTPSEVNLLPRPKPYRYTGEDADAPLLLPEGLQSAEGAVEDDGENLQGTGDINEDYQPGPIDDYGPMNGNNKKPRIVSLYNKGDVQVLKAPNKKKIQSGDLVSYLSDFLSEDERRQTNEKDDNNLKFSKLGDLNKQKMQKFKKQKLQNSTK